MPGATFEARSASTASPIEEVMQALAEGRDRPLDDVLGRRELQLGAPVGDQLAQLSGSGRRWVRGCPGAR